MINPIKYRREYKKLTQDQLAKAAGVTRQVVTLAEQGLYNSPPESLIVALVPPIEGTFSGALDAADRRAVLRADYLTWVNQKRYENQHLFRNVDLRLARKGHEWFTLKNQVSGKSAQAFARALVYQPSLIKEFEKYGRGSASIFAALSQVGLEQDQIALLRNS